MIEFIEKIFLAIIGIIKMIGFIILIFIYTISPRSFAKYTEKEYRDIVLLEYPKKTNIIMDNVLSSFKYNVSGYGIDGYYNIKLKNKKELNTKYISLSYDFDWYENEYMPFNIHTNGEKEYIINNLIFNHSKGNYFDKIEEYLDENKENILKLLSPNKSDNEVDIVFKIMILSKFNKEVKNIYFNSYNYFKIEDNKLKYFRDNEKVGFYNFSEEEYFDIRHKKEKIFFSKPTKYKDINWSNYMEYMDDYPVLIMEIRKKDYEGNIGYIDYSINNIQNKEEIKEIEKIYREIEKWYNPETFGFVIKE